jgi:hypothetical protein
VCVRAFSSGAPKFTASKGVGRVILGSIGRPVLKLGAASHAGTSETPAPKFVFFYKTIDSLKFYNILMVFTSNLTKIKKTSTSRHRRPNRYPLATS